MAAKSTQENGQLRIYSQILKSKNAKAVFLAKNSTSDSADFTPPPLPPKKASGGGQPTLRAAEDCTFPAIIEAKQDLRL
ncbi:MAG: hypothetical protein DWH78_02830 [Planctomycetota bacterium]|nr:MAG: hypothetical protein DWH78_02830 [Planctomycetota bacterium]